MAITDFPKIPDDLNQRIGELTNKVKKSEISQEDVIRKTFTALGKTRIDHTGIKTSGQFGEIGFDSDDLKAMIESGKYGMELASVLYGKEFLIKAGNKIEKIKLGLPFKTIIDHISENDQETLPIIEFKPDEDGN